MKPLFGPMLAKTFGTPLGKAVQRSMMEACGGPSGIRKTFRTNPDGSTTMLSTRAGMAEFSEVVPPTSEGPA